MTIHPKQKLTVYTGRSKKFKLDSNLKNSQAGPKKANKGLKGGQINKNKNIDYSSEKSFESDPIHKNSVHS